jgi:hypothetical protein
VLINLKDSSLLAFRVADLLAVQHQARREYIHVGSGLASCLARLCAAPPPSPFHYYAEFSKGLIWGSELTLMACKNTV